MGQLRLIDLDGRPIAVEGLDPDAATLVYERRVYQVTDNAVGRVERHRVVPIARVPEGTDPRSIIAVGNDEVLVTTYPAELSGFFGGLGCSTRQGR